MVLGDALERLADEAHAARRDVGLAAEIIEDLAAERVGVERVDGEVAARGVVRPIVGEGDGGAAAVGVDVAAQGGDFDTVPDATAVTVPWAMPVGTALMRAPRGGGRPRAGRARVARSRSSTGRPSRASRTAPPTKRAPPCVGVERVEQPLDPRARRASWRVELLTARAATG